MYSLESTIAEKFDALLQRMELTSRMKDIYDIYYLAQTFDFDGCLLQQAIYETLSNRGTYYEQHSFERIIALSSNRDISTRWQQYLRRSKLPEMQLDQVMLGISDFLGPIWNAIIGQDVLSQHWPPSGPWGNTITSQPTNE